jgi:hypothetical protein
MSKPDLDNVIYLPARRTIVIPDEEYDKLVDLVGGDDDIAEAIIAAGWRPPTGGNAA